MDTLEHGYERVQAVQGHRRDSCEKATAEPSLGEKRGRDRGPWGQRCDNAVFVDTQGKLLIMSGGMKYCPKIRKAFGLSQC